MKEYNIAICDDEQYFIDDIKQYINAFASETSNKLNISEYNSGVKLIEDMKVKNPIYHIIFIDIDMPEKNGVDTAKEIRNISKDVIICFITSHNQYALEAYAVNAIGYIVKPAEYLKIKDILKRGIINIDYSLEKIEAEKVYIDISTSKENIIIDTRDIVYIEKRKNQCIFHMIDGEITCYDSLKKVYDKLDKTKFTYSHQGYIVNYYKIKEVKKQEICFGKNTEVPLSRKYYKPIKEWHMNKINRLRSSRIINDN